MDSKYTLSCFTAPFIKFVVSASPVLLGRSSQCQFVVNDSSISRKHAELRLEGNVLVVTDLTSRNGTFVDDRRVTTSKIEPGQLVRFGGVVFSVSKGELNGYSDDSQDDTDQADNNLLPAMAPLHPGVTQDVLSDAHRKVFELLLTGCPEKNIARRLNISSHTVHNHVKAIFRRLGVHSRAELLAKFIPSPGKASARS